MKVLIIDKKKQASRVHAWTVEKITPCSPITDWIAITSLFQVDEACRKKNESRQTLVACEQQQLDNRRTLFDARSHRDGINYYWFLSPAKHHVSTLCWFNVLHLPSRIQSRSKGRFKRNRKKSLLDANFMVKVPFDCFSIRLNLHNQPIFCFYFLIPFHRQELSF